MDDLIGRIIVFLVGCAVGFVLGYIVRKLQDIEKEVDEIATIERKKDEQGILQRRVAFNIAFVGAILLIFYSAYASYQNAQDLKASVQSNFVSVCKAAADIRHVERQTVEQLFILATSVIPQGPDAPPRSPAEVVETNLYIDRVNTFRETMYDQIKPTDKCAPFVTDDNVEPPSPPFPHVEQERTR